MGGHPEMCGPETRSCSPGWSGRRFMEWLAPDLTPKAAGTRFVEFCSEILEIDLARP
jgi:hypothetical protein